MFEYMRVLRQDKNKNAEDLLLLELILDVDFKRILNDR
jgi:hypothetical protein